MATLGWPFPTASMRQWDLDVKSQDVPLVAGTVHATLCFAAGCAFSNPSANLYAVVQLIDAAGFIHFTTELPPNGSDGEPDWNLKPILGPKWVSSIAGVHGHVWGYHS
jgi:hypothetical protein